MVSGCGKVDRVTSAISRSGIFTSRVDEVSLF